MTEKRFIVDGDMVRDIEGKIPTILTYNKKQLNEFLDGLNELNDENEQLKKENEQLKQSFINLIDKKIKEFQNGDYGDLPCNTIHMFLDLKEEIGDVE